MTRRQSTQRLTAINGGTRVFALLLALITTIAAQPGLLDRSLAVRRGSFDRLARDHAARLEKEISSDLANGAEALERLGAALARAGGRTKIRSDPLRFSLHLQTPFAVMVERNPGWDAELTAKKGVLEPLTHVLGVFRKEFLAAGELEDAGGVLMVVLLRDPVGWRQILLGRADLDAALTSGTFALRPVPHVMLLEDVRPSTLYHEATHMLVYHYRRCAPADHARSLWFEEGLAEWIAGVASVRGPSPYPPVRKELVRCIARGLDERALDGMPEQPQALTLKELLDATVASRDAWQQQGSALRSALVYAQGWALVQFLRDFDLDAEGHVKISTNEPGRHLEGWHRYIAFQMRGKDGRPHGSRAAFQEALGLDDTALEELAEIFHLYQQFLIRKVRLRHLKDSRLIPWHEYRSRRGEATGRPEDDLLRAR